MNRCLTALRPLAFAAAFVAAGAAQANITVYTTEASFLAAISNFATDSFDDLPIGSTNLESSSISRTAGSISYTASVGADSTLWTGGTATDVWLTTNAAADVVTFDNFSSGVYAAGGYIFGSDISGLFLRRGSVTVTATDASGTTTVTKRFAKEDNFFGFVSDSSLSSVTVSATSGRRAAVWPTIDNLTLAAAVPEPETYALLLSGLAVVGFIARRRREH